jgi:hypothetical protein
MLTSKKTPGAPSFALLAKGGTHNRQAQDLSPDQSPGCPTSRSFFARCGIPQRSILKTFCPPGAESLGSRNPTSREKRARYPDFPYAAPASAACAAFNEESRMKLVGPAPLHRKSGGMGHPGSFARSRMERQLLGFPFLFCPQDSQERVGYPEFFVPDDLGGWFGLLQNGRGHAE